MKENIVVGLDIGTHAVKVMVAARKAPVSKNKDDAGQEIEVLSQVSEPSQGVRKGVVISADKTAEICQIVLEKAQEESGQKIDSVYVNINGAHLFSVFSHGLVSVSRADRRIPPEDVERVVQAAQAASMISSNKEVIKSISKEFIVDGVRGLKEVVGMEGARLEADVLSMGAFSPYLNNLTHAVISAGVQINDIMPSPLASARAVLANQEKELGVALVEIGAGTTGIAVYQEGELLYTSILPIGSGHITNDIAVGLKIDPELAEKIKLEFGTCLHRGSDKKEKMEMEEGDFLTFSHRQVANIVGIRVSEILGEVGKELKKRQKEADLPSGIVLTGGGVKIPRIIELAKKELKTYCRIGRPLHFSSGQEDVSLSAVCGLVLGGFDLEGGDGPGVGFGMPFGRSIGSKLKRLLRIFIP